MKKSLRELREAVTKGLELSAPGGKLQVQAVADKAFSHKTSNKGSDIEVKEVVQPANPSQIKLTKAVLQDLKAKGQQEDITTEFNVDPSPDIVPMADGGVVITPDDGSKPYKIPEKELEKFYEGKNTRLASVLRESMSRKHQIKIAVDECLPEVSAETRRQIYTAAYQYFQDGNEWYDSIEEWIEVISDAIDGICNSWYGWSNQSAKELIDFGMLDELNLNPVQLDEIYGR